MKSKMKLLLSFLLASAMIAPLSANSYVDGIEYFKAGQPERARILLERTLNDPETKKAESYYYLGEIAFLNKDYAKAQEYYDKGVATDPMYGYNLIGQGKLLLNKQDIKGAEAIFKAATKLDKKNSGYQLAIAKAYYRTGTPGYEKYLEKARKQDKNNPDCFMFIGDMKADAKDNGAASQNYEMAILKDSGCVEAYVKYSHVYFNINADEAIQKLELLLAKAPTSALAQREMAEAYYKKGQYSKAVDAYERYIKNPNHFETDRPRLAALLYYDKRYDESLALAAKILEKDPSNFVIHRVVMYDNFELKKYAEAEAAAELFFNGSSDDNNVFIARDYLVYGDVFSAQKKYVEAASQYQKAFGCDSTNVDVIKKLSDVYDRQNDYDNAILYYKKYMEADAEKNQRTMNFYNLGQLHYSAGIAAAAEFQKLAGENAKKLSNEARAAKEKADAYLLYADTLFAIVAEKAPEDVRGYIWRARSAFGRDQDLKLGLAKPFYLQTLEILDKDPANKGKKATRRYYTESYNYLANYYYQKTTDLDAKVQKDAVKNARHYWSKMLELDPNNKDIKEMLDTLK